MLVTDDKKSLYFKVAGGSAGAKLKKMTLPVGKGPVSMVAVPAGPGKDASLWVVNTSETTVTKITLP